MFTCLIFNINVAGSVTAQGRALISTVTLFFESFLNNNVKFGSLDEVLVFINSVLKEDRSYKDSVYLEHYPSIAETFTKLCLSCGYRWYPNEDEMQVIWEVVCKLGQEDLNRIYYKNNLYEFLENPKIGEMIIKIMKTLKNPFFNSLKPPKEILDILDDFTDLVKEYVYYDKMIIDRIDRCASMIKSTIMISDTDSCIISLDAWYRFVLNLVKDEDISIAKFDPIDVLDFIKKDEFGDIEDLDSINPLMFKEREEHYDFMNDEIIYEDHEIEPFVMTPQDYMRYSIINIMGYVIDKLVNDYLEKFTKSNNSWSKDRPCKIILKNEFTFMRILMTLVKKSYASLMGIQEGNVIPKDQQVAITGMDKLAKSSTPISTRKAFKDILVEDILRADTIDQFHIIERLAIMERKIIDSIHSGSVEFYKPVTIKAMNAYTNPMSEQGIKASYVWNYVKDEEYPGINLDERNAVLVAKVDITCKTIEKIKDKYPEQFTRFTNLLNDKKYFKGRISSLAIPRDVNPPSWFLELIDYKQIVNDNVGGFSYDSSGLVKLSDKTNYSNILQL